MKQGSVMASLKMLEPHFATQPAQGLGSLDPTGMAATREKKWMKRRARSMVADIWEDELAVGLLCNC